MRCFRHLLLPALLCLWPALAGAEPCATARLLTGLYQDMERGHAAGGRLTLQAARHLMLRAISLHPRAATAALAGTGIADRMPTVLRPLEMMRASGPTQSGDRTIISGLHRAVTGRAVERALAVLAEMDCAPPPPSDMPLGPEPVWDAAIQDSSPRQILAHYGGSGAIFAALGLMLAGLLAVVERRRRLMRRRRCAIPVTFPDRDGNDGAGHAVALGRELMEVSVAGGIPPQVGQPLPIGIGEDQLIGTVVWANAHAFGAELDPRLTPAEIKDYMALSLVQHRGQRVPLGRAGQRA